MNDFQYEASFIHPQDRFELRVGKITLMVYSGLLWQVQSF